MSEGASYLATSRPYVKRYGYQYRRHVFDKLRALDLVLAEFQQLLGHGEVIAEAEDGPAELREIVLLVEWSRPLHVVTVVDSARQEERLVTVYEPDPSVWTADYRWRR
ncbi:MAG: hypothetical protein WCF33_08865 [Pseudonocardiaceae bacterium]